MGICDGCIFHADTWSEELRKEYNGCTIFLIEKVSPMIEQFRRDFEYDEQIIFDYIDVPQVGFGWIKTNVMAVNDQLIVKDVIKCAFFEGKK